MSGRYLTAEAKAEALREWQAVRAEMAGVDGPGVPDPGILPWCERINALPGLCTLQSCEGHEAGERGRTGHLWLWMDGATAPRFHRRAFELTERRGIERVSVIYQPWGQEITEIEFQGSPDGQLDASMRAILDFFGSL